MGGDLFYLFGFVCVAVGLLFGEVQAGDLQAVEEESCSLGVEVVGGDALEDDVDGGLDGAAVFGQGEVEGGFFAEALAGSGLAGGVVVVAEGFSAEADAAAAVAVGADVAAFEAGCRLLAVSCWLLC